MKKQLLALSALLFFTTSQVYAQSTAINVDDNDSSYETETSSRLHFGKMQRGDRYNPEGLWPFLGVGAGFMGGSESLRTGGIPTNIKFMGSYYFAESRWVGDAGLGLFNQVFTQSGSGSDAFQAFYLEASGRYKLENQWQVGPSLFTLIDTSNRLNSGNHDLTSFVGVQALKEFNYEEYLMRMGGRLALDLGISGSTVPVGLFELQVTWGDHPNQVAEVEPAPAPVQEEIKTTEAKPIVNYNLKPDPVRFETNKTVVVPDNKIYMKKLARTLANNKDLYDRVEVVGHADVRGTKKHNVKLSKSRAINIAAELKKAGLDNTRITTEGVGAAKPRVLGNNADAYAQNRRVELKFIGVQDEKALSKLLQSVEQ